MMTEWQQFRAMRDEMRVMSDEVRAMRDEGRAMRKIETRRDFQTSILKTQIYRVMYVTKFADKIYVLHSFQKKTQKTSPKDINIAKIRYKSIIHEE